MKPTLEEVEAYADERGHREYAHKFFDHYCAVGWKMGKSPITDWQAAFRKWERTEHSPRDAPCQKENRSQSGSEESFCSIADYEEFVNLALKSSYGDLDVRM